jgi:glycosyltransferase involved in cell wall biosynthesis
MAPLFAAMAGPLLRARRVPLTLWYARGGRASLALRLATRWADTIVTPSPGSFPLPHRRVLVTGHGIDTDLFSPAPAPGRRHGFRVVSLGRIAPVKRLEILVDAARRLREGDAPEGFHVSLVGPVLPLDCAYGEALRQRIIAAGLDGIVTMEGPVAPGQVPSTYRAADVAVNVSETDSVDKAALEAMACGLPVVVTNRALAPIVGVADARCVAPPGDAGALAARLAWLAAASQAERSALGERLRAVVMRDHSLHRLTERLVGEALGRPRPTPGAAGSGA